MTDSEVVERLRRIDALQEKITDLIHEIEDSEHPKGEELADDLWQQCWFAASAEHVGIDYLDPKRWSLWSMGEGCGYGRIISRQLARKKKIETIN